MPGTQAGTVPDPTPGAVPDPTPGLKGGAMPVTRRTSALPSRASGARAARQLLDLARSGLADAQYCDRATNRYAAAHLAALRAAAAVLALRAQPETTRGRGRIRNVWVLLARVAPHLREWAAYFAAGAPKRAAAEAGLSSAVTPREADDLLRDAALFLSVVEEELRTVAEPGFRSVAGEELRTISADYPTLPAA